jgi:hypothetical protein
MQRLRLLAAAATLLCTLQAQAFTATLGTGDTSAVAGAVLDGFDATAAFFDVQGGSVFSSATEGVHLTGDNVYLLSGVSAQPHKATLSSNDAWLSVGRGQSATVSFAKAVDYVGFLWGSADRYNTVSFFDGTQLIASFQGGAQVGAGRLRADGNQSLSQYFNFSADHITSVQFSSASPAFEIDNLAARALPDTSVVVGPPPAVPEPDTFALALSGLAVLGWLRSRRAARA